MTMRLEVHPQGEQGLAVFPGQRSVPPGICAGELPAPLIIKVAFENRSTEVAGREKEDSFHGPGVELMGRRESVLIPVIKRDQQVGTLRGFPHSSPPGDFRDRNNLYPWHGLQGIELAREPLRSYVIRIKGSACRQILSHAVITQNSEARFRFSAPQQEHHNARQSTKPEDPVLDSAPNPGHHRFPTNK
jgi:hypothetical protein